MKATYFKPGLKIVEIFANAVLCYSRLQGGENESTTEHENEP